MIKKQTSDRLLFSNLASLVLIGSVAFRSFFEFRTTKYQGWETGLVVLFTLLYATEGLISKRFPVYRAVYFFLQTWIIIILLIVIPPFDYFTVLFIPLTMQAFWLLSQRNATVLTGVFAVVLTLCQLESYRWEEGIGYALTYTAVLIFVIIVCLMTLRAERAQAESQALLAELRAAHGKLQAYAEQVEDLATAQERNRLARELHDSVTQTIFSLTLTAQAARILLDRDPSRVAGQLDHLQNLAQNALSEMRSLIQQQARSITEIGLAEALRRHAAERERKDGLRVEMHVDGSRRLAPKAEEAIFRVVQEALNNVVKHAQTDRAVVTARLQEDPVLVTIDDQGAGFDPAVLNHKDFQSGRFAHFGLSNMAERIEGLGGKLAIESSPGSGTHIRIEVACEEEQKHE
jgi:signal transduction histidine kinase